jgi:membrane protease YdiL (CAAX protease family)
MSRNDLESGLFPRALGGLAWSLIAWPFVFRSRRANFWARMAFGAGSLGAYALWARPSLRRETPRPVDILPGVASAAGLYAIFQIGDRLARRIMPHGEEDITNIYSLRASANPLVITALLGTIIGPSEELFWRGLIQRAFMERWGDVPGTAAAAAAYAGVHLVTGNLTLTGAAGVAGAYWGAEYTRWPRLGPLLVSHILWDLWIFLLAPTPTGKARTR